MSLMRAGVNGVAESDTSKIIQILGNNNTMNPGEQNSINPLHWDHYPSTGTDQEKKRFLKDERVAIAIELDQSGSKIDKIVTEITYHYPSYPVEGYVTVTYNDRNTNTRHRRRRTRGPARLLRHLRDRPGQPRQLSRTK